jgi:excisionase family DNA binding protein
MESGDNPDRMTFSVSEAATALGIGRTLAYQLAQSGQLGAVRVGGRWVVPRRAIDRLLEGEKLAAQPGGR